MPENEITISALAARSELAVAPSKGLCGSIAYLIVAVQPLLPWP